MRNANVSILVPLEVVYFTAEAVDSVGPKSAHSSLLYLDVPHVEDLCHGNMDKNSNSGSSMYGDALISILSVFFFFPFRHEQLPHLGNSLASSLPLTFLLELELLKPAVVPHRTSYR